MQVTAEADPDAPTNAVIVRSAEPDLLLAQRRGLRKVELPLAQDTFRWQL